MADRKQRYSLKLRVAYDDGENFMTADVYDISESGLYLETVMPLKIGTKVTLTPLADGELGIVEIEGEVVRKKDYDPDDIVAVAGMGIRFVDADKDVLEKLCDALAKLGTPKGDKAKS